MQPVDLAHASRLLNHGPTVMVSVADGPRRNVMSAAWSMPVEFTPPRVAVVIDKSTYTRELLLAAGRFALNLPCQAQADLCFTVGSISGRDLAAPGQDKFARFGIAAQPGAALGQPLLAGCVAWLECELLPQPQTQQDYDTFIGEVKAAWADPRVFAQGRWSFREDNQALHTLHHLGAGLFTVPARTVQAQMLPVAP